MSVSNLFFQPSWRSFLLFVSLLFIFSACQKESLEQTTITNSPKEQHSLDELELRELVLDQVFGIPTTKIEHPKMQQLATSLSFADFPTRTNWLATRKRSKHLWMSLPTVDAFGWLAAFW